MRIFDIHTHPIFNRVGHSKGEISQLVKASRALGIVRMNILGDVADHGPSQRAEQITKINDDSGWVQSIYPDFFTTFCYLNPTLGERAVMREVERCVTQHGACGIKLEAANSAADPCMKHVAKAAREFELVVLQHSWTTEIQGRKTGVQTDPEDTALFAKRYPDVSIIMAHLMGIGYRGVIAAKGLPNLYVDTSGGYPQEELIAYAIEHLGADHLLYGSDLPIRESCVKIGAVLGAQLSAADRQNIFHDNAARLVGLM